MYRSSLPIVTSRASTRAAHAYYTSAHVQAHATYRHGGMPTQTCRREPTHPEGIRFASPSAKINRETRDSSASEAHYISIVCYIISCYITL